MVEAAGVEPASQTKKPAATTCLVRKDFLLCDDDRTRVALPSPHGIRSACCARSPLHALPAIAFVQRSRCPPANVAAVRPRGLILR